ncbi:hypothetical protein V1525DRAFT_389991 [Lipomyces kononenkoae]|uniref:Uncharacterized protein n=1 Tax=Lipomyces kononenkoae TaxID=34357 RepID=A0ACC3SXS3_LIPKO
MPPSEATSKSGPTLPLCEHDFFRRKSLLCHVCGGALRGDYVMAVGKKYHLEHFTCSICPRVFQADDNYYERDGAVYCHFHFSTLFADRCEGCHTAILKQFVENLRNGRHERWHPECYMIHKFWNVRLSNGPHQLDSATSDPGPYIWKEDSDLSPEMLKEKQKQVEIKVYRIWTVLSEFEEVSAACISDMLQYATNGATMDALLATGRLIYRIQVLFAAIDNLRQCSLGIRKSFGKEPKTLCKNVVNFLTTLPGGFPAQVNPTGKSKDLLDLVTSMAHYLKLLIQFGLSAALEQDKASPESQAVDQFLEHLSSHNAPPILSNDTIIPNITDQCVACKKGIEDKCARLVSQEKDDKRDRRWHLAGDCFVCSGCTRNLADEVSETVWSESDRAIICQVCTDRGENIRHDFTFVSRLNQYSFLLKVALQRVYKSAYDNNHSEILHRAASADKFQSIAGYVNTLSDIRRLRSTRFKRAISDAKGKQTQRPKPMSTDAEKSHQLLQQEISSHRRRSSKKSNGSSSHASPPNSHPKELGSSPMALTGSPSVSKHGSRSTLLEEESTSSQSPPMSLPRSQRFSRISTVPHTADKPDILFGEKYLTLDDIPRIVAVEQAREQRPNAFRHQRQSSLVIGSGPTPKLINQPNGGHQVGHAGDGTVRVDSHSAAAQASIDRMRSVSSSKYSGAATNFGPRKFFSELLPVEYFLVRQYAADALRPLLAEFFAAEELAEILCDPRTVSPGSNGATKMTFWEKFGKAFAKNSSNGNNNSGSIGNGYQKNGSSTPNGSTFLTSTTNSTSQKSSSKKKGAATSVTADVFKVPLEVLVDRSSTDSELGVSKGALKVPAFLDDVISAMRRKDMSVEGVFRKNGNIRKLKGLAEQIDKAAENSQPVDLDSESPVQLAALLKKFLRELPDPLLTFNLYKIWVASQRITDDNTRLRVLHLCCCLLPRVHRDSMEIIFNFLKWVASFSHVDEESGSKMDIHNLSTVITPNILYASTSSFESESPTGPPAALSGDEESPQVPIGGLAGDNYFLAIEAVNSLIENHEELSLVPEDIVEAVFNNSQEVPS